MRRAEPGLAPPCLPLGSPPSYLEQPVLGCGTARSTNGLVSMRMSGGEPAMAQVCYLLSGSVQQQLGVRGMTSVVGFGVFCLFFLFPSKNVHFGHPASVRVTGVEQPPPPPALASGSDIWGLSPGATEDAAWAVQRAGSSLCLAPPTSPRRLPPCQARAASHQGLRSCP